MALFFNYASIPAGTTVYVVSIHGLTSQKPYLSERSAARRILRELRAYRREGPPTCPAIYAAITTWTDGITSQEPVAVYRLFSTGYIQRTGRTGYLQRCDGLYPVLS
jgi:hypothetical protein